MKTPVKTLSELNDDVDAQTWEQSWWGDCLTTFGEEAKQLTYAHRMGLANEPHEGKWPAYNLHGKSVLDLGGGPTSILLKTRNRGDCTVVDPCPYPDWISARYDAAGIKQAVQPAETFRDETLYDEAWCYNVLQHVIDPEQVIETAKAQARSIRIFEWIDTETNVGHPHSLHADDLNRWVAGFGQVGYVNENGAVGLAWWGHFPL